MLARIKRWLLGSFNYTLKINSAHGPLVVPVINDVGRAHLDEHERHMQALLARLYRPGTLLIDVGTNIGQTLLKYVSVAGRQASYMGFEPNAKAASYVEDLIIRNRLTDAIVVPVGLGATTRLATLLVGTPGTADPGASINESMRDADFYGARKGVAIFAGDAILAELGINSGSVILKVDVEGAELEVLHGLSATLRSIRPAVILEILPPGGFSDPVNLYRVELAKELHRYMAGIDYDAFAIGPDGELHTGLSSTNDYLFLPRERSSEFASRSELTSPAAAA